MRTRPVRPFAAAVVAALAFSVLAGCTGSPDRPAEATEGPPSPPPPVRLTAPPAIPSQPGLPGRAHQPVFARDGSGFALLADCVTDPSAPENGFCRPYVAVLDAGAKEWVARRSPLAETRGTEGVSAHLLPLGPGRALIEDFSAEPGTRTWFTRDGGRNWRRGDTRTVGTTPDIPADGVLATDCAEPAGSVPDDCARQRLVVVSPVDGRRRALARVPSLGAFPAPAPLPEPDGSWWVSGADPRTGRAAVAVSRDAGRSWRVSALPSPAAGPGRYTAVVVGQSAVYAAEMGELSEGKEILNSMRALHRSVDGGRTWRRMWTTGATREPRSLVGLPVPGPGGRVEIASMFSGFRSVDGGRTFVELDDGTAYVRRTALGLLREDLPCQFEITRDGVRWSRFLLACGEEGAAGTDGDGTQ